MISRRLLGLGAAALALGACSPGRVAFHGDPRRARPTRLTGAADAQVEIVDLYRSALVAGEKTVVVYSCTGDSEWEPLWALFAQTFPGLSVTYSHISPSQVMIRMDSERATGRAFGDVFMPPVNLTEDVADKGYFLPFTPRSALALEARYRDPEGLVHYPFAKVFGVAYNTRAVSQAEAPRRIGDLLAPRWRGRFTYIRPATQNGTTDVAIANLLADGAVTPQALAGLRDQGAYANIEAGVGYVSQGRQDLQLWAYLPTVLRQEELGAPVAIAFPPDLSTLVPFGAAISRNTVHPNAARLFQAWILTPDAQAALAREVGMFATLPGAPTPPFFPTGAEAAAIAGGLPPKRLQVALAEQRPLLRSIFSPPTRRKV